MESHTNRTKAERLLRHLTQATRAGDIASATASLENDTLEEHIGVVLGMLDIIEDKREPLRWRILTTIFMTSIIALFDLRDCEEVEKRLVVLIGPPKVMALNEQGDASAKCDLTNSLFLQSLLLLSLAAVSRTAAIRIANELERVYGDSEFGRRAADIRRRSETL